MLMHKPGILPLRPLKVGDILSATFAAVRAAPRVYFGLVLLLQLFTMLTCGAVAVVIAAAASGGDIENNVAEGVLVVGVGGLLLAAGAVSGMCSGLLAYPLNQQAVGRRPRLGETWRMTRRRIPAFLGVFVLFLVGGAAVMAAAVAVLIAGAADDSGLLTFAGIALLLGTMVLLAWLGVRISLTLPALFTENLGPIAAIRRSWTLTDGLFWRTLGNFLLMYVIVSVIQWVIQMGFQILAIIVMAIDDGAESTGAIVAMISLYLIGAVVAVVLTQPFMAVTTAVLHLDSRIRKDGFDLDLGQVAAEVAAGQHTEGWQPLSRYTGQASAYGQPPHPFAQIPYTQNPYTQAPYSPYGQPMSPYGQQVPPTGAPAPYPGQYPPYQP
ncbi:hypothetical protein GOAMR_15_00230 [Gordonia amarae NBRC 15530]|uniref:Glycerophosphoryl diester phosphodiesterase membrane domain-containing protein n=2 Tax=Gordonia amarae TaxID=36821 RepID=G7GKW6_9ACTN|nr:hypothetical protein GOAMR_15_00230 [Gordonia amarae NBRC 15530]